MHRIRTHSVVPAALAAVSALLACDSGPTDPGPVSLAVSPTVLELAPGMTGTLQASATDGDGNALDVTVTWSTGNADVATVDEGVVTAVGPGSTIITAEAGGASARATVRVVQPLGLVQPLIGTLNQDFFLVNYVDLDDTGAVEDYHCGIKSYNGHNGTDITLKSFAQMDTGIAVVAAAAGTVVFTSDGAYDRNKSWDNGGGFANHVVVEHDRGYHTYYAHLANGSVAVAQGQAVAAGTHVGLVGSSGTSDHPHLHFELRKDDVAVDPYAGDCNPRVSHWADQNPYQDAFHLIDSGITTATMDLDLAKDPPPPAATVSTADQRVYAWVHLHNLRRGSTSNFRFLRPDGSTHGTVVIDHDTSYSMSWWWAWQSVAAMSPTGTWSVEYSLDGAVLATSTFELTGDVAQTVAAGSAGHGGGGLRWPRE